MDGLSAAMSAYSTHLHFEKIFGKFLAHVYCGQMTGWIKMPLGREVGLNPRDIVLDVLAPLPEKAAEPPNFRPMSIVARRLHGSRCHLACR